MSRRKTEPAPRTPLLHVLYHYEAYNPDDPFVVLEAVYRTYEEAQAEADRLNERIGWQEYEVRSADDRTGGQDA